MNESRALLLTDVVDSTKLSESIGDAAMAEVCPPAPGSRDNPRA